MTPDRRAGALGRAPTSSVDRLEQTCETLVFCAAMDEVAQILAADVLDDADREVETTLRPRTLAEYVGQPDVKTNLACCSRRRGMRDEAADHVLLYGPPGLGKTTLATIIARELGVNIRYTSGPAVERAGDLAAILTSLDERDVLFIDEIHRLNRAVEEILYPAMEDFALDVMIGKGPSARSLRLTLKPFTVVGATTRAGPHLRPAARPVRRRRIGSTSTTRTSSPRSCARSAGILGDPGRPRRRPARSRGGAAARRAS